MPTNFLDQLDALAKQAGVTPTETEAPVEESPEVPEGTAHFEGEPLEPGTVRSEGFDGQPEVLAAAMSGQPIEIPEAVDMHINGMRFKLRCEGSCTNCAHCGQPLTDSISQERGIGPICSKKGYLDEVVVTDDQDALIALAEYPVLVDYLTRKYKGNNKRELVNGLVRTASLNRRTPVHGACTDSIEMLGFKRLASTLRESLAVVSINKSKEKPGFYEVWVKSSDFDYGWWNQIRRLDGVHMRRHPKATFVPVKHRNTLAKSVVDFYSGLYLTTDAGSFKITPEWFGKVNSQPAEPTP